LSAGCSAFYLAVVREGEVEAGDPIVELDRDPRGFKVTEIARLYIRDRNDIEGMRRAAELDVLPEGWRDYFLKRIYGRAA
jgi:MOSC domain-containing protein YiiM